MQRCGDCVYYSPLTENWNIGSICSIGMYSTKLAKWVEMDLEKDEDKLTCPGFKWRWILFEE